MKKIGLFSVLFLLLTGFQLKSTHQLEALTEIEAFADVEDFLKDFEKAIKRGNASEILTFFDKNYKEEQHDKFLEGRTEQFINEFFGGQRADGSGWANIKYRDIKKMKRLQVNPISFEVCEIAYLVKTKETAVKCNWSVVQRKEMGKTIYGLIGAVG